MDHYSIHTGMGLYSFMVVKKSWHCAYDIHYHFVFVVKYRKSLLDPEVVEHLKSVSQEIAARYEIETLGTDDNHIGHRRQSHPPAVFGAPKTQPWRHRAHLQKHHGP